MWWTDRQCGQTIVSDGDKVVRPQYQMGTVWLDSNVNDGNVIVSDGDGEVLSHQDLPGPRDDVHVHVIGVLMMTSPHDQTTGTFFFVVVGRARFSSWTFLPSIPWSSGFTWFAGFPFGTRRPLQTRLACKCSLLVWRWSLTEGAFSGWSLLPGDTWWSLFTFVPLFSFRTCRAFTTGGTLWWGVVCWALRRAEVLYGQERSNSARLTQKNLLDKIWC